MSDSDNETAPSSNNNTKKTAAVIAGVLAIVASITIGRSSCGPTPAPTPLDAITPPPPPPIEDATSAADAAEPARCDFVGPRSARKTALLAPPRIVGGTAASEGTYPYAAAIATPSRFQYCGGTVIAPRYVLTAAHCQVQAGDLVLVGSVDLTKARAVKIVESRINPAFDPTTLDYDVAIAVLAEDVGVENVVRSPDAIPALATVIGWGATIEGGSTTALLRQVDVPLWTTEDCKRVYPTLTSRQICAGRVSGGADSCQGDSGGSLLIKTDESIALRQLGIVSFGIGCARPGVPGVYTDLRAPEIRSWIDACEQ